MNNDKEIKTIMSLGSSKIFTVDPSHKDTISKTTIDELIREAKRHLALKKKVHFVIVKE